MQPGIRKALEGSISHWARLVTGNRVPGEAPDSGWCDLCALFYNPTCQCDGCPVKEETGVSGCADTPYKEAAIEWECSGPDSPEFRKAAKRELEFLKSLLPSTKEKPE